MPSAESIQQLLGQPMQSANPQLTKTARRLYVGNLPVGMGLNEKILQEFFQNAVANLGLATPNPVLSVWMSSEGTFCFVELRSVKDCTLALGSLQGLVLGGRQLRIGRPADYKPPPPNLEDYIVGPPPGVNPFQQTVQQPTGFLDPLISSMGLGDMASGVLAAVQNFQAAQLHAKLKPLPSKVICLKNMVTPQELVDDEEYLDIELDVKEECVKFGPIHSMEMPRPKKKIGPDGKVAVDESVKVPGVGLLFIKFVESAAAGRAVDDLDGRMFNDNRVEATYFPEDKYDKDEFA